ncbi:MAG: hypothetical protein ACI9B8_003216 [Sulfitobacter sp.]
MYLDDAFSGNADNIYMVLDYATPFFSAVSTSGLFIESWFDIYDGAGNLLAADDQWPTGATDLMSGDYQVNLGLQFWMDNSIYADNGMEMSTGPARPTFNYILWLM